MSMAKQKRGSEPAVRRSEKDAIVRKYKQYVRIRPLMEEEKNRNTKTENPEITNLRSAVEYTKGEVQFLDKKWLTLPKPQISKPSVKRRFTGFDGVFWSFGEDPWVLEKREKTPVEVDDVDHVLAANKDVYEEVKSDIVSMLYDGYNQTVAAYGPINGGKTFTLFGPDGIAPLLLKDLVNSIESQIKERQAPGEELSIVVEARCYRVYKEEIEDCLHGYPRMMPKSSDASKVSIADLDKATKLNLSDPEQFSGFAERVWSGKEAVRRPSHIVSPNKNNRSSVVVVVSVTQTSNFKAAAEEDQQEVEKSKVAYLTLADIGHGGKADSENQVEYKKISQAQTCFQQCIRKLGDKGAELSAAEEADKRAGGSGKVTSKIHVPFNGSMLTRILGEYLEDSHVTLICCISPYHNHHPETQSFMELAEYGTKARSKAAPMSTKEVEEFRENLKEKQVKEREVEKQSKAVDTVKKELTSRQNQINTLKRKLAEGIDAVDSLEHDISEQEEKIQTLQWQLKTQKVESQKVYEYFNDKEKTAVDARNEAVKKMDQLRAEIEENERKVKEQGDMINEASNLIKRAAGLKALLTGQPMKADEGIFAGGEDLEGLEVNVEQFEKDSSEAADRLKEAIVKYEKVVNLNEENNKLLADIQQVLTKIDQVEEDKQKSTDEADRQKRRCIREMTMAIEDLVRGTGTRPGALKELDDLISKYMPNATKAEMAAFFKDELTGVNNVLGSEMLGLGSSPTATSGKAGAEGSFVPLSNRETEEAPGWCKWKKILPARPLIQSLRGKRSDKGGDCTLGGSGTAGSNKESEARYRVESLSNEDVQKMIGLVQCTGDWCNALIAFNSTREAIEAAYEEWLSRLPEWPKGATEGLKQLKGAKDQDDRVAQLNKDITQLKSEIDTEQKNLERAKADVKTKEGQLKSKQAELKKLIDKCVIL